MVRIHPANVQNYTRFGYRFLPLVREEWGIACAVDILFLRRDDPGKLITSGGDLDNRIKVLFDALKVPANKEELEGVPPVEGEDPFFCLLEDDKLIVDVKVTTDRLLLPLQLDEHENDVFLVLNVKTRITNTDVAFTAFGF